MTFWATGFWVSGFWAEGFWGESGQAVATTAGTGQLVGARKAMAPARLYRPAMRPPLKRVSDL